MEATNNPITQIVTEINVPVYFVMGKYDGMTSPESAQNYLEILTGDGIKEFILFEESAHYPQFEEEQRFYQWMKETTDSCIRHVNTVVTKFVCKLYL